MSGRFGGVERVRDGWARLVSLDVTPVGPAAPRLKVAMHNSPVLSIGAFEGTAARMVRTRTLAEDCRDDVMLCLEGQTRTRVEQGQGGAREFRPGDVHVWRADRPMLCETEGAFSTLMLALPQSGLRQNRVDCEPALAGGGLDTGRAEVRLLSGYARSVAREMETLSPTALARCTTHIHDLALLALGGSGDPARLAAGRGVRAARLKAIKNDIEAHLTDPALGVAWITGRHRISERYLRALFAGEGTSFTDFVLERRLALAHARLGDPGWRHASIGEIAYDSGFGDLSWFNRAFRKHYDAAPSDIRARS